MENKVYETLRRSFTHEYVLTNSFIFDWESDYFAVSKSGYLYEIEVKHSKADFVADFKKVAKHKRLELAYNKNAYFLLRKYLEYDYDYHSPINDITPRRAKARTLEYEIPKHRLMSNPKLISTSIEIKPLFVPHRFYYACPTGVIDKKDVPKYAGLFYISDHYTVKMIKQAPFIHKKHLDIKGILLHKFYHLSLSLRAKLNEQDWQIKQLIEFDGDIMGLAKNIESQTKLKL